MAGLLALIAARAFALGGDGFAATSRHVPGTPVEMLIQDGVGEADVRAVAAGSAPPTISCGWLSGEPCAAR